MHTFIAMKSLYIHRHAKSSWNHSALSDFERPLNERGFHDAPMMGKRLLKRNEPIELIVSSPAVRALSTAKLVAKEIGYESSQILEQHILYLPSISDILQVVNSLDDSINSVMLFGHNPGFTQIINYLAGDQLDNLPTAGCARIDFQFEEWQLVSGDTGKVVWLDYPKNQ